MPSTDQMMVRLSPKRPKDAPARITLPWLDGIGRRFYSAEEGFVAVPKAVANLLRNVHCDGELTERGGQGPLLFDVYAPELAQKIAQIEEKRALVEAAGREGNNALKAALAGTIYSDEELDNLGIERPAASSLSAVEIARRAAQEARETPVAADPAATTPAESAKRVGRRPPRSKVAQQGGAGGVQ